MNSVILIFCYILVFYGLTLLLVDGMGPFDLLDKNRAFWHKNVPVIGNMLECYMCTSTNLGWIFSLCNILLFPSVLISPFNIIFHNVAYWWAIIPLDAFFTCGVVWFIHIVVETLEAITEANQRKYK